MALLFKDGVSVRGIRPECGVALTTALSVFDKNHIGDLTVTSCTDSIHMVGSLHYKGLAFDIKTHGFSPQRVFQLVKDALPWCVVLLENLGQPEEHVHCQVGQGKDWTNVPEISGPNVK